MNNNKQTFSLTRLSRSLVRLPSKIFRVSISRRTSRNSSTQSSRDSHLSSSENGNNYNDETQHNAKPLLNQNEIALLAQTLNRALKESNFGIEIVLRWLNDKRSNFKRLLLHCAAEAHEIEVFDVTSLVQFCPRAVEVGERVTLFFKRVATVLEECESYAQLEEILSEMCRTNGQLHYRMKVWFQAENWLCVKHSIVDTVLTVNSKDLKRGKHKIRTITNLPGSLSRRSIKTKSSIECIEMVWLKLMQAVITWMKQGFLEAAMSGKEEQDEEL